MNDNKSEATGTGCLFLVIMIFGAGIFHLSNSIAGIVLGGLIFIAAGFIGVVYQTNK